MKTILASTALALVLTGAAQAQSLGLALDTNPDRETSGTFRYADNLVTELGNLGWDVETFPRDTIGGEDERLDQIRAGILDMSMADYAAAVPFVHDMEALQLPYTFRDPAHQEAFFNDSDFLARANERLEGEGMRIVAVVPNGGFLGIFNDERAIRDVSDMQGIRMRAMDPNQLTMFEMMGASGVVIPFSEVPNAIQTGIADGYVNAASVPISFGQADLFTSFTDAKVIMSARLALASTSWWDGLSDKERAQFEQASTAALSEVFDWVETSGAEHRKSLEAAGIAVYEPTDEELETFREATRGMSETLDDVSEERIEELRAMVAEHAPD